MLLLHLCLLLLATATNGKISKDRASKCVQSTSTSKMFTPSTVVLANQSPFTTASGLRSTATSGTWTIPFAKTGKPTKICASPKPTYNCDGLQSLPRKDYVTSCSLESCIFEHSRPATCTITQRMILSSQRQTTKVINSTIVIQPTHWGYAFLDMRPTRVRLREGRTPACFASTVKMKPRCTDLASCRQHCERKVQFNMVLRHVLIVPLLIFLSIVGLLTTCAKIRDLRRAAEAHSSLYEHNGSLATHIKTVPGPTIRSDENRHEELATDLQRDKVYVDMARGPSASLVHEETKVVPQSETRSSGTRPGESHAEKGRQEDHFLDLSRLWRRLLTPGSSREDRGDALGMRVGDVHALPSEMVFLQRKRELATRSAPK